MPGHTRLYRRGATYYHRAVVPKDIVETYGKREETFSLRTKDHAEACRRVRVEAVRVDQLFEYQRRELERQRILDTDPPLQELSAAQLVRVKQAYLHHLLDEDEDARLDGFEDPDDPEEPIAYEPRPTFEERQHLSEDMDGETRSNFAQGKRDVFFRSEAEEVLTWHGIDVCLAEGSPSWPRVIRVLQEASVEANEAIRQRDAGNSVPTPDYPTKASRAHSGCSPLLSEAVRGWEAEKIRGAWSVKVRNDYVAWITAFIEVAGDRPITDYSKADARDFKAVLLKLPANWRKTSAIRNLPLLKAAEKAHDLGLQPMNTANLNKAMRRVSAFFNYAEAHYDGIRPSLFRGLPVKVTVSARVTFELGGKCIRVDQYRRSMLLMVLVGYVRAP